MLECLFILICAQEVPQAPGGEPPRTESTSILDPVHGTIRMSYRYRATSADSDSDLYEILTLTYGNPEKDPVTAALCARFAEDLDGNRNVQGFYPFTSSDDARRSFATQRLYTAYLDYRTSGREFSFRGGRQILDEFPEAVAMDGGLARVQIGSRVTVSAFGGIPVNLFEPSPSGDAMYGASAEWVPDPERRGRYRMEYLHIRDDNVFGLHKDDLLAWSLDERCVLRHLRAGRDRGVQAHVGRRRWRRRLGRLRGRRSGGGLRGRLLFRARLRRRLREQSGVQHEHRQDNEGAIAIQELHDDVLPPGENPESIKIRRGPGCRKTDSAELDGSVFPVCVKRRGPG